MSGHSVCRRLWRVGTAPTVVARIRMCAVGFAVLLAGGLHLRAQVPTFSTSVEAVRVDALVTDRGRPIQGLTRDDFELLDSGVPQRLDWVDVGALPVNVVLVLDTSDSVTGPLLEHLRAAGDAVLDTLRPNDQVAVVGFTHLLRPHGHLTAQLATAREVLREQAAEGQTALIDATFTALMLTASDAGRGLVMVFSDGVDTASWLEPETVVDAAKRGQAVVYAVATRRSRRDAFLRDLTKETGGTLWTIASTDELEARFIAIVEEFRHRYLLAYTPRNVPHEGWHQLTVRVKGRRATVQARPGYVAGPG